MITFLCKNMSLILKDMDFNLIQELYLFCQSMMKKANA